MCGREEAFGPDQTAPKIFVDRGGQLRRRGKGRDDSKAGRDLLSLCEKTCTQAGIDTANSGNIFLGCFDLLDQLITNELAVMNIADVVGALHVQRHLNNGIDLEEQAKNNNYLALAPGVKAMFSIIKNEQLIQLDGDIGPRLRL